MKRLNILIVAALQTLAITAQEGVYSLQAIADSLKQKAYSIVQEYHAHVSIQSQEEGEAQFRQVITILDEKGKRDADFVCFADKFRTFDGFRGELLDASGKRVMSLKKSDLKSTGISEDLASDDKTYFYNCSYEKYPYTIVYEWNLKYKHGFLSFPSFIPVTSFNQSLINAQYTLTVPKGMEIDYRMSAGTEKPVVKKGEKSDVCQWQWEAVRAFEHERLGPGLMSLVPRLYIKPLTFIYDKYAGRQSTWEELSAWHYSLLQGRDVLTTDQQAQIKALVEGIDDNYEKVKKLYTYMGEKMRYVSIQLGIGGLQPMTASETQRMGFGDCKALSYYLKTMLQTIGIASEYVAISVNNARLYADYPNVQQMDHVILKVPLKDRTLWLECTNPTLPFGYIHSGIAGHDALIIRPEKGALERLPVQGDSLHTQNYQVSVKLTDTPQTEIKVECKSRLSQYEANVSMLRKKLEERKDRIRKGIQLNRATLGEVEVIEASDPLPELTERYTLQAMYGNKNGNRLFIPVNPFREEPFRLSKDKRKYDIHLNYGYLDKDTIRISLPDGYQVETKPKDIDLIYPFGHIQSKIEVTGQELVITQSLLVNKGIYPVGKLNEFIAFSEAIKKAYNGKVVLKK